MASTKVIPVANLLIDVQNPRLEETQQGQSEALRSLASDQKRKLLKLAQDILKHGLNPLENILVTPVEENPSYYTVLEGNRRLTALLIMENPDIVSGIFSSGLSRQLKQIHETYKKNPIESVLCTVMEHRPEADHWIELRHTGQNDGAGLVSWNGAETARFRARRGKAEIHIQVLDFLEEQKVLNKETRQQVPVTSLRRLIGDPYVRDKLGIDVVNGEFHIEENSQEVARKLMRVVEDFSSGEIPVSRIYHKNDRIQYIDDLEQREFAAVGKQLSGALPILDQVSETTFHEQSTPQPRQTLPFSRQRVKIVPRGLVLKIPDRRINSIYGELKTLKLNQYPNAIAVLFRVFLELSVDAYIVNNPNQFNVDKDTGRNFPEKIRVVAEDLHKLGKLNIQQLKATLNMIEIDENRKIKCSTITTLHQYVHNQYFTPAPADLCAVWDQAQSLLIALWN